MVKVLSNFDTELDIKLFDQCVLKYADDEVLLIRRDNLFFVFHVIVPAVCFVILTIALLAVMYFWTFDGAINDYKNKIILFFRFLLFLVFMKNVLTNAIDFKLDFAIATPCEVIAYEQTWFLNRSWQTVESQKIKTVTVNKNGIFNSLFNVGDIIILSEGDKSGNWDIELEFIHNPDKVAQQMKEIFNNHDKFTSRTKEQSW